MVVNSVVIHWLSFMLEDGAVVHDSLGHVLVRSLVLFCTDDRLLGSWYPEWLQGALNVIIGML